jgi:hypothetical protein
MDTKEHLIQTLEHFRKQRNAKIQEARSFDAIIRSLEQELGNSAPPPESMDSASTLETPAAPSINGGLPQVRPDEFYSMTQTDAAKAYLKKVGRAISMEQLLDGMKRGGAHVGGADPKSTLYVSLMRNPRREFVRVSEGFVGLREFYPGLGRIPKNGKKKSAKRRKKQAKRRGVKPTAPQTKPKPEKEDKNDKNEAQPQRFPRLKPSEMNAEIRKVLLDGQLHTGEAIQEGVEKGLGFKVHPMSVFGCLRSRDFERVGGQYRLKK